jgi:hypothetical protein
MSGSPVGIDDGFEEDEVMQKPKFPRYLMWVDGKGKFMPIQEAGVNFDSGWSKVEIGGLVLEEGFIARKITGEERLEISRIADEYSSGK